MKLVNNMLGKVFDGIKGAVSSFTKNLGTFGNAATGTGTALSGVTSGPYGGYVNAAGQIMSAMQGFRGEDDPNTDYVKAGKEMGAAQKAFMDLAYPGTTSWERLGTGQTGASGGQEVRGQDLENRLHARELNNQRAIAAMNNKASVAQAVIAAHPESAKDVYSEYSVVRPKGKSLPERKFRFDQRIRSFEAKLKASGVKVDNFKAATERYNAEINAGRFDFERAVKAVELEFHDRKLAQEYVRLLNDIRESTDSNLWRLWMSSIDDVTDAAGLENWMTKLKERLNEADRGRKPDLPGISTGVPPDILPSVPQFP